MPQRVTDERLAILKATGFKGQPFIVDHLVLDLLDARQQVRDANAAIMRLQRELEAARRERDERPVL